MLIRPRPLQLVLLNKSNSVVAGGEEREWECVLCLMWKDGLEVCRRTG